MDGWTPLGYVITVVLVIFMSWLTPAHAVDILQPNGSIQSGNTEAYYANQNMLQGTHPMIPGYSPAPGYNPFPPPPNQHNVYNPSLTVPQCFGYNC